MTTTGTNLDKQPVAQDLARLREVIDGVRERALGGNHETHDISFVPYLERCARDLEDAARMVRATADHVAMPEILRPEI